MDTAREERLERLLEAVRLCARLKCLRPLTVMDNHQLEALRRVRELEMEIQEQDWLAKQVAAVEQETEGVPSWRRVPSLRSDQ